SEEHTSELQSLTNLVCRLLLEKKKSNTNRPAGLQLRAALTLETGDWDDGPAPARVPRTIRAAPDAHPPARQSRTRVPRSASHHVLRTTNMCATSSTNYTRIVLSPPLRSANSAPLCRLWSAPPPPVKCDLSSFVGLPPLVFFFLKTPAPPGFSLFPLPDPLPI